ncbi:hypothetical protein BGW39_003576 [Mortierella sp. 14UC]|nr:hypothetical protein BGW39_003576 [Mortierella sp. 14UC]
MASINAFSCYANMAVPVFGTQIGAWCPFGAQDKDEEMPMADTEMEDAENYDTEMEDAEEHDTPMPLWRPATTITQFRKAALGAWRTSKLAVRRRR